MKLMRWLLVVALIAAAGVFQGCALFVVGAVAGAAGGGVSYLGNELCVTQEVTVDRVWNAAHSAVSELQFSVISTESYKDGTGGTLVSRNAKQQKVKVVMMRQSDRLTEIRIRVGSFNTAANRAAAQLVYDKMKSRM